jgi:hypothetical protein
MSAGSEWRQVERQLVDLDLDVSDVLEPKELQRLFLEVRGELAAEQVCHHPCRDCPGCLMGLCKIANLHWEAQFVACKTFGDLGIVGKSACTLQPHTGLHNGKLL